MFNNKRQLVLIAPSDSHPDLLATREELLQTRRESTDRDLVVREYVGEEGADELPAAYAPDTGRFVMILVGKDGTEKRRDTKAVPIQEIYALIDTMPMRKREMRERGASS